MQGCNVLHEFFHSNRRLIKKYYPVLIGKLSGCLARDTVIYGGFLKLGGASIADLLKEN